MIAENDLGGSHAGALITLQEARKTFVAQSRERLSFNEFLKLP
jgi:hypothetical protein